MRNSTLFVALGIAGLIALSACTVHDVDAPPLTGPSTFATSIVLRSNTSTLIQDGVSQAQISITAVDPQGNPKNIPLRAEIRVDGVAQDYGRLSTKQPTANGTPLIYTAPPPSAIAANQAPQTVQIFVTPMDSGDFASELSRFVAIQLLPQGVILPTNPDLVAGFDISPATPQAFQTVTFDASKTTNKGAACLNLCTYSWNFGDGATASGISATHVYRSVQSVTATLTVTDGRGAQATSTKLITPSAPSAPSGTFTTSPTSNLSTNNDIVFTAVNVKWDGRTITSYDWNFGDGGVGSGVTTTHRYSTAGTFTVTLTVTDDQGAQAKITGAVTVTTLGGATANLVLSTSTPTSGSRVVLDATTSVPSAGASIVSYRFIYGDGNEEVSDNGIQSHVYTGASNQPYTATVVITDSNGKTASKSQTLTIK